MGPISTYVIFDIETTGLPRYERNRTKITELTFLAVDRRDIETANAGCVPLINKLSYLFNPQRTIMPEVKDLTGLSNRVLQNQLTFKNRIQSITSFLEELPKPVCLVAHNGNSFDFKLLRTEFIEAGENLPNDLLCVDSLWGFKKILKEINIDKPLDVNSSANSPKSVNSKKVVVASTNTPKSNKEDDLLTDDEDWPDFNTTAEEWAEIDKLVDDFSKMSPQETRKRVPTDSDQIEMDKIKAIENVFAKKPKTENVSCTLQALYKRLLNKEAVNAHRSEADCIMLLECIVALKDQFIPYTHEKCKLISSVKPFERY